MASWLARWQVPPPWGMKSCAILAETPERIDSHATAHYSGVVLIFVPKGGTLAPEVALI